MKSLSVLFILMATIYALNGCATPFDTDSASKGGETVPGEVKNSEESRVQPSVGAGGPNASVKW